MLTKASAVEGSWGPEYAQLHDDVLSGRTREQYLVVEGIEGLADSLSLIAGMLYVAILSGRALQIRENVPYSVAYDRPNIDWRYGIIAPLLQHAHKKVRQHRLARRRCMYAALSPSQLDSPVFQMIKTPSACRETTKSSAMTEQHFTLRTGGPRPVDEAAFRLLYNGSVEELGAGANIVTMFGNVGVISVLFNNPVYKVQLYTMGLRPETAYGCALEYLFTPSLSVKEHFRDEIITMTGDSMKIGIQVRLGDGYLKGGVFEEQKHAEASLLAVQHFFKCAEQLQSAFRQPGQDVVWLLISDSLDIRSLSKTAYGDKLLVKLDEPSHVAGMTGHEQNQAMIAAAGEHWLFGLADYHVISSIGGFGRSAALRAQTWNTVYKLDVYQTNLLQCDGLNMKPLTWDEIASTAPFV